MQDEKLPVIISKPPDLPNGLASRVENNNTISIREPHKSVRAARTINSSLTSLGATAEAGEHSAKSSRDDVSNSALAIRR
ncbi:MAG TPA: hypothetical protein VI259_21690 [Gemmatimonadaceae bacterium]